MSYVWTPQQFRSFYANPGRLPYRFRGIAASFTTTQEFARTVLPPCLEPAAAPRVSISANAFLDWRKGVAGVEDRDRASSIRINSVHDGREGLYYLTTIESVDDAIAMGRELWGWPKKCGAVDVFDDGVNAYLYVERKNRRLITLEAHLGEIEKIDSDEVHSGWHFELKASLDVRGTGISHPQLVVIERETQHQSSQLFADTRLELGHSEHDPGVATVPVGDFQEGRLVSGQTTFIVSDVVDLAGDGNDYAPYVYGRLFAP